MDTNEIKELKLESKQLYRISKIGCWIMVLSFIALITTTLFFLYRDGWHVSPETQDEQICDFLASLFLGIGALMALYSYVLSYLIKNILLLDGMEKKSKNVSDDVLIHIANPESNYDGILKQMVKQVESNNEYGGLLSQTEYDEIPYGHTLLDEMKRIDKS